MRNVFLRGTFYTLTDLNIQTGAVLFGKDLYLFNPASLQIAPLTYDQHVDWVKVSPIRVVLDISEMRYHDSLRPIENGSHE